MQSAVHVGLRVDGVHDQRRGVCVKNSAGSCRACVCNDNRTVPENAFTISNMYTCTSCACSSGVNWLGGCLAFPYRHPKIFSTLWIT